MIEKKTLDLDALALRIKREMLPGQLVSVGSGLPNAIGKRLSYDPHAWLIDEDGELTPTTFSSDSFGNKHGSSFHSISDVAAMMHGGQQNGAMMLILVAICLQLKGKHYKIIMKHGPKEY